MLAGLDLIKSCHPQCLDLATLLPQTNQSSGLVQRFLFAKQTLTLMPNQRILQFQQHALDDRQCNEIHRDEPTTKTEPAGLHI